MAATHRRLRIEADGGSRGNPGIAGYGALVRDEGGLVIAERAAPLGKASNNVAEYSGLIAGLQAAEVIDPGARITVAMDSKLVVEQMSGRWKIKHADMRTLALEAKEIIERIVAAGGSVDFTWIPRERNKAADALSNEGMDGRTIRRDAGLSAELAADRLAEEEHPGEPAIAAQPRPVPPLGEPTRIILVRHGVTAFTEQGRLDGRGGADPDLSDLGREQAAHAARLVADLVAGGSATLTTSTLARARQTGVPIAAALGVTAGEDPDWDEQNFGDWDGVAMRDLMSQAPADVERLRSDPAYARPGGETHRDLTERVLRAYAARVAAGGTQVIVAHRKPIMVVLADILGMGMDASWRLAHGPGALTAIETWPQAGATVVFTNRR